MKRRTLRALRPKSPALHHHVYVVLLDPAAAKLRKKESDAVGLQVSMASRAGQPKGWTAPDGRRHLRVGWRHSQGSCKGRNGVVSARKISAS
jgi:hypothetical protein